MLLSSIKVGMVVDKNFMKVSPIILFVDSNFTVKKREKKKQTKKLTSELPAFLIFSLKRHYIPPYISTVSLRVPFRFSF